ncbi:ATP-grasp domain-containing protein [Gemmata sp.]|uniref:ATP-grasp domain-containing protein n=1 Tax=Gemmata sp. TaxID=1914242 RepID=UPI003F712D2A
MPAARPFAVYHEHPDWFRPLFAELERRGLPFVRLDPRAHVYDPGEKQSPYALVFNRMSPSAYLRGGVQGMFFTLGFMAHLERLGVPVVNGSKGFAVELSKARQLTLLESLGLGYPKARVINHPSKAVEAAEGLRFPVVVKANVGGSGAGIVKFETREVLAAAAAADQLDFGVDHTALVQEFVPARGGHITRVETLGGKYLYAIKVFTTGESFNLCPADICQRADGVELVRSACPVNAPKTGMKVEGYTPPADVIAACERIMQTAGIDVGGIEYMTDDRDGSLVYYDVNALSNFVADAVNVVGFDPFARLVDYLEKRAG